jgi:hypothetical protein
VGNNFSSYAVSLYMIAAGSNAEPQTKKPQRLWRRGLVSSDFLAPRPGLEPGTYGLTVHFWRNRCCSLEVNKDK